MKKQLQNAAVLLLALLPAGYFLLIWTSLPEIVPVHFGPDMKPDRIGNKVELWLPVALIAVISILVYFLFQNLHRIDPKRKDAAQLATFQKLGTGMVVFLTVINFLVIRSAKGDAQLQNLLFPLLGLLFAFIGNYMIHIKPNYFAGFRLPWTLSNDDNWRKTHELGGKLWFAGGMLIAIVCFFLPATIAFVFFLTIVLIMMMIPLVYSYRLFKKQT